MSRSVFVSTSCVRGPYESLEEHVAAFREAGLESIELGWAARPATPDLESYLQGATWGQFLIHNYFPQPVDPFVLNLASQDAGTLARSLATAQRALHLSSIVSAPYYSVHAGFRAEFSAGSLGARLEREEVVPYECALRTFRDSIVALAKTAEALGVDLLIEPNVVEARNLVEGVNELLLLAEADEMRAFLDELARPRVGVLLDTGHLNVTSTTLRFSRDRYVEQPMPWIRGIHLHDNDGLTDQHIAPEGDSWVFDLLEDSSLGTVPIVIEAAFRDVSELSSYHRWCSARLNPN
jgi:sugar phosphate isomerase/epimerase